MPDTRRKRSRQAAGLGETPRRRWRNATPGGKAGVPGTAFGAQETQARGSRGSRAAHQFGNGGGSAIGRAIPLRSERKCFGGVERFAPPRRLLLERFAPVGPSVAGLRSAGNGTKHSFSRRFPERKYSRVWAVLLARGVHAIKNCRGVALSGPTNFGFTKDGCPEAIERHSISACNRLVSILKGSRPWR